jgi:acetyl-CoA C-acetyltransferase
MLKDNKIVLCEGLRTPIGHFSKSLAHILPEDLLSKVIDDLLIKTKLPKELIDGIIIGWVGQGSHAPNIARISSLKSGLPLRSHAMTIQCNWVSGMESISSAARNIILGEGDIFLAGGTESMSTMPYAIRGPRSLKELRNLDTVKKNWNTLWDAKDVEIMDCIDEGLTDPVKKINMAQTAEVCTQKYDISRKEQDDYTAETFKRCYEAEENGFYSTHISPITLANNEIMEKDEYVYLRKKLVENPEIIKKAPLLFERSDYSLKQFYDEFGKYIGKKYDPKTSKPGVTLFNACVRSDSAAVVIVTTEEKAKELDLKIIARIKGWAYQGFDPALMGVAPAMAAKTALDRTGLSFDQLDDIELHEAFAATVLSAFKVGEQEFGHKWKEKWEQGKVNPTGSSIALGHPLAATGTRLVLSAMYHMQQDKSIKYGMAAACAAGGIGGAMILENYLK